MDKGISKYISHGSLMILILNLAVYFSCMESLTILPMPNHKKAEICLEKALEIQLPEFPVKD